MSKQTTATETLDIRGRGWSAVTELAPAEAQTIARLRANGEVTAELPDLSHLTGLRFLHLTGCRLRRFPPKEHLPPTLVELNISSTEIEVLPLWLTEFPALKKLFANDCPLSTTNVEVFDGCAALRVLQVDSGVLTPEQFRSLTARGVAITTGPARPRDPETPLASWGALFAKGVEDPVSAEILNAPVVSELLVEVYAAAGVKHIETIAFEDSEGFFDTESLFPDAPPETPGADESLAEDEVFVTDAMLGWCAVLSRRLEHVEPEDHPLARALSHHTEVLAMRAIKGQELEVRSYRDGLSTLVTTLDEMGLPFTWRDLLRFDGRIAPPGLRTELMGFRAGTLATWEEAPELLFIFRS